MKTLETVAELRKNIASHFWKDSVSNSETKIKLGMGEAATLSFEISKSGRVAIFNRTIRTYTTSTVYSPSHYSYETAEFSEIQMLIKEV